MFFFFVFFFARLAVQQAMTSLKIIMGLDGSNEGRFYYIQLLLKMVNSMMLRSRCNYSILSTFFSHKYLEFVASFGWLYAFKSHASSFFWVPSCFAWPSELCYHASPIPMHNHKPSINIRSRMWHVSDFFFFFIRRTPHSSIGFKCEVFPAGHEKAWFQYTRFDYLLIFIYNSWWGHIIQRTPLYIHSYGELEMFSVVAIALVRC